LVLAAGCSQILGVNDVTLGDGGGGGGGGDGGGGSACVMGSLIDACFHTLPAGNVTLNSPINTDTDSRCVTQAQPGGPDVCMIGGATVMVTGTVRATGKKPLVLVAVMDLTVNGVIDVSGIALNAPPAAVDQSPCPGVGNGLDGNGPGGGGGGAFGTGAKSGGQGAANTQGAGGTASTPPAYIRGGCSGGKGGNGSPSTAGLAGIGGGAVYLLAGDSIDVGDGSSINASGGGGGGGSLVGGGGGGGAGGMIGLDAPEVDVEGDVFANGAGGGGGGDTTDVGSSAFTGSLTAAAGGMAPNGASGTGGNGGVGAQAPLVGSSCPGGGCGGGGGGGSVGVIWMNYQFSTVGGNIVPDAIP
jgi:hypothetical protein